MIFFKNIEIIKNPTSEELILFSADDVYFQNFGIYNIFSCDGIDVDVHAHVINPSEKTKKILRSIQKSLKINLSYSFETLQTEDLNYYFLKSYYYCARFYIADYLFEKCTSQILHIVDADVIFNQKILWGDKINLALEYDNNKETLWQKILAGYVFIKKEKHSFLKKVLNEYEKRLSSTDFENVDTIKNKIEKANITGLDQVCLSYVFENEKVFNDVNFYNIKADKSLLKSKNDNVSKIWVIVGKNKFSKIEYLKEKYQNYLKVLNCYD